MTWWKWLALAPLALAAGCATRTTVYYPAPLDCLDTRSRPELEVAMVSNGVRTVLSDDFKRYYPKQAVDLRLSGWALIDCGARTGSEPCKALSSAPPEAGFDAAAQRLSRLLRGNQRRIRIDFTYLRDGEVSTQPDPCPGMRP